MQRVKAAEGALPEDPITVPWIHALEVAIDHLPPAEIPETATVGETPFCGGGELAGEELGRVANVGWGRAQGAAGGGASGRVGEQRRALQDVSAPLLRHLHIQGGEASIHSLLPCMDV